MLFVNILILLLLITKVKPILQEKLVYQMDISEYCKRRVLPSIFLAKNSVDSSAFIMHLTQIELPFSCAISVRTESGNNIIMAIKIDPLEGIKKRCKSNTPELLVHKMGETFGGYWGPIWKKVFEHKSVKPKIYTLKTTQKIPSKSPAPLPLFMSPKTTKPPRKGDSGEDGFIEVDVPLVNVSGKFVSKENSDISEEDEDAMFDIEYNVTPEPGVDYTTSVIPIVQFSLKSHPGWRKEGDDGEPRFDLDIVEKYTPDHRLTMSHYKPTTRLKFRKINPRTTTKRRHQYFRKNSTKGKLQTHRFTPYQYTGYNFPTTKALRTIQNVSRSYSWKTIQELINKVNLTASLQKEGNVKLSDKKNSILKEISDMKQNSSIYLKPILYGLSKSSPSATEKRKTFSISEFNETQTKYSTKQKAGNQVRSTLSKSINKTSTSADYSPLKKHDSVPSDVNENYNLKGLNTSSIVFNETDNKSEPSQMPDKSLVDHESWENVVQSASDMAVLLNITKEEMKKHNIVSNNGTANKRKKRDIHAISILNARPHNVTTSPVSKTSISSFGVADLQEFSQLVELWGDELYGRVALRYLRQFVGPAIYNVCHFDTSTTAKQQSVLLFNASRIVIAINNLTNFAGLTMILTTARALVAGEIKCPLSNIECQVAGARVCIDAMTACDGVPNCGSYDVYDEDRLMCGKSEGLQHNVYTAAFTFLAVLLTLLYTIHYWLRRCVPKVADAFFIYTNGTENILLLQPNMRSPNDYGDRMSKLFFHSNMFEDIDIMPEETKINCCKRFMRILCCGLTLRKRPTEQPESLTEKNELINLDQTIKYSFTQLQLQNIMERAKMSFQSDSIELTNIKIRRTDELVSPPVIPVLKSVDSILTLEEPLPEDYKDELGILKFLKTARKNSMSSDSKDVQLGTLDRFSISFDKNSDEMEIKNFDYNRPRLGEPGPSGVKPKNKKEPLPEPGTSGIQNTESLTEKPASKRLRFNDNTTMIPASIAEIDEDEEEVDEHHKPYRRHSTFLDTVMGKQKFFAASDDDNEPPLPKEHKSFWGGSGKSKKPRTH